MQQLLRSLLVVLWVSSSLSQKTGEWGPWSDWSQCSRSCGGGVSYQERHCLDLSHTSPTGYSCVGEARNYQSCNIQDCPEGSKDFRNEQCAAFNKIPYEGKIYKWMAFYGGPNKCQLNCMPMGEHFYLTQAEAVIDGTRCEPDSFDVCVDGRCEKVGCDMLLHSNAVFDQCGECGGDNSSCKTFEGTFDVLNLEHGYNDILTIPAGATSILIQETRPSLNFLALRNTHGEYYLNGDFNIGYPRPINVAGTTIHYETKYEGSGTAEVLRSNGPLTEPIHVMLLTQEENKGISYEYSVPNNAMSTGLTTYSWSYGSYEECSKDCGTGYQTRDVFCINVGTSEEVNDYLCDSESKPHTNQTCNTNLCPASWHSGDWSPCPLTCDGAGVVQVRMVVCERELVPGRYQHVNDSECDESLRPPSQRSCNADVPCPVWNLGEWSQCSESCGPGRQFRSVSCSKGRDAECANQKVPANEQECNLGPCGGVFKWLVSDDWSKCSGECGESMQTRQILCVNEKGDVLPDEYCTNITKPDTMRSCTVKKDRCKPRWATSVWTKCSSKCGQGMRSRFVFCASYRKNRWIQAQPKRCKGDQPHVTESCDSGPCEEGVWLTSAWSECSQTCGTGERSRDVMCFINGHQESTMCNDLLQPHSVESCINDQDCPDDVGSGTVDELPVVSFIAPTETPESISTISDQELAATTPPREATLPPRQVTTEPEPQIQTTAAPPAVSTPEPQICNMGKDSGPCRDFGIFWYHDNSYGACNRFWYGGCFGNRNRYATEEECDAACGRSEEPLPQEEMCTQPKNVGPCNGSISSFFYNTLSQQCEEFTFGGCLGNNNRFRSIRECEYHCGSYSEDPCTVYRDKGRCDGRETRWFYNLYSQECQEFNYTGCGGNQNRFYTQESCERRCLPSTQAQLAPTTQPETEKPTTKAAVPTIRVTQPPVRASTRVSTEATDQQVIPDLSVTRRPRTRCEFEQEDASTRGAIGSFIPRCTEEGLYERAQCHGSTGYCFCVNEITGAGYDDSYTRFSRPDCTRYYDGSYVATDAPPRVESSTTYIPSWEVEVDIGIHTFNFDMDFTLPRAEPFSTTQPGEINPTTTTILCSDTTFGCCPDGIGIASGTNYIGCPDVSPAVIISQGSDPYTVQTGSTVEIVCEAYGSPEPVYYWVHDGIRVEDLRNNRIRTNGGTLRIEDVVTSDVGSYECNAYNGIGSTARMSFQLDVISGVDYGQYASRAVQLVVQKGNRALLPCNAATYNRAPVSIFWQSVDNENIQWEDGRYTVLDNNTLQISDVQLGDAGTFMCTGRTAYSTVLRQYYNLVIQDDVDIFIEPQDIGASVGESVVFQCASSGAPSPTVYWYLDDVDVYNSPRKTIESSGNLVIRGVKESDAGRYMCIAANGISSKTASAVLTVHGATEDPDCRDRDDLADCRLVLLASYCHREPFNEYCCKTCKDNNF